VIVTLDLLVADPDGGRPVQRVRARQHGEGDRLVHGAHPGDHFLNLAFRTKSFGTNLCPWILDISFLKTTDKNISDTCGLSSWVFNICIYVIKHLYEVDPCQVLSVNYVRNEFHRTDSRAKFPSAGCSFWSSSGRYSTTCSKCDSQISSNLVGTQRDQIGRIFAQ
jgi:hypothetical protein